MDNIKKITKNKKELETRIQAIRIYGKDTGIEFSIEKYAMLKNEKRETTKETEQPDQENIKMLTIKENYKYLGILEVDTIKQTDMEPKIRTEYFKKTRKLLEPKLCGRNFLKEKNPLGSSSCKILWVVPKRDKVGSQTNGPKKNKTGQAQNLTTERWYR